MSGCASMSGIFWRQFAAYADYHRDKRNCTMHIIRTPLLFLAALLPFSLLSVTALGLHSTTAALLIIPALIFWKVFDLAIGATIACLVIPLLITAAITAAHVALRACGRQPYRRCRLVIANCRALFFEQRRPVLPENPLHMHMSPMFIVTKLFVALGFRWDLAAVLSEQASDEDPGTELQRW